MRLITDWSVARAAFLGYGDQAVGKSCVFDYYYSDLLYRHISNATRVVGLCPNFSLLFNFKTPSR